LDKEICCVNLNVQTGGAFRRILTQDQFLLPGFSAAE